MITLAYCKTYCSANGKIVSESYLLSISKGRQLLKELKVVSSKRGAGQGESDQVFFPPPNQRINRYGLFWTFKLVPRYP